MSENAQNNEKLLKDLKAAKAEITKEIEKLEEHESGALQGGFSSVPNEEKSDDPGVNALCNAYINRLVI